MDNVLTRKLEGLTPLSAVDRRLLDDIVTPARTVAARTDLITEGEPSDVVRLVGEGLACRYKTLETGGRQIVAYLVPGDFCDLHASILRGMDHDIATISVCKIVDIPRHRISEMLERPALARALWWATLVDEGTLREWLLNVGKRSAIQRIAHLFCELHARMRAAGLVTDNTFALPLIQSDIADAVGLSPVHVNRCLQQLREMDILQFRHGSVEISDIERLAAFSGFNPNYLHLDSALELA